MARKKKYIDHDKLTPKEVEIMRKVITAYSDPWEFRKASELIVPKNNHFKSTDKHTRITIECDYISLGQGVDTSLYVSNPSILAVFVFLQSKEKYCATRSEIETILSKHLVMTPVTFNRWVTRTRNLLHLNFGGEWLYSSDGQTYYFLNPKHSYTVEYYPKYRISDASLYNPDLDIEMPPPAKGVKPGTVLSFQFLPVKDKELIKIMLANKCSYMDIALAIRRKEQWVKDYCKYYDL